MENRIESNQKILSFILAGKSIFTIRNEATGNRFTYKVKQVKTVFFVSLMFGTEFKFIGTIFDSDKFVLSKKSKISTGHKAFNWLFTRLITDSSLETVTFWHEGKCGRCGRKLTVPESIQTGFGKECIKLSIKCNKVNI